MTAPHDPTATDAPTGVDTSWHLPHRLRPAAGDLPALAWLAARQCNGAPDEPDVDRYRAAAALPLWLTVLAVQHATGTLAARGRDAFVVLAPTWAAAQRPYRAVKTAALAGGAVLVTLLVATVYVAVWALGAAAFALGVPRPTVALAELVLPVLAVAVWGIGLLAHPSGRVLVPEVRRWSTSMRTATTGRTMLATSLCGRGRPSIAAARLGRDVLELADARGWALLTNGGVPDHTARQYARVGFAWLPDSTRRMLRPAARPGLVDVAVQHATELAGRVGVRLDEVRLVDAATARAGRSRGRTFLDVPAQYLLDGAVPGYARAAIAHEVGHHALGHFTALGRLHRVGPKVTAWAVLVLAAGLVIAVTHQLGLVAVAAPVTLAGVLGVGWLCDRPVRRQEYQADAFAIGLVGVSDVVVQLRRLQDRAQAAGRWARRLDQLFTTTHPPVGRRLERVLQDPRPAPTTPA